MIAATLLYGATDSQAILNEVTKLRQKYEECKANENTLDGNSKSQQTKMQGYKTRIQNLENEIAALKSMMNDVRQKNKNIESDIALKKRSIQNLEATLIKRDKQYLQSVKENELLRKQVNGIEVSKAERENLKRALIQARSELEGLKRNSKDGGKTFDTLQKDLKAANAKIAALQSKQLQPVSTNANVNKQMAALQYELTQAHAMISELRNKPVNSVVQEKIVYRDRPVEKIVEKVVYRDRNITKPVERVVYRDRPVEKGSEKVIYKDRIVEKVVYRDRNITKPVEKVIYRDRPIEKVVEKVVYRDRPVEKPVEKVVYKDRVIEKPVEKIVYKDKVVYKDRPVEKIVEKVVYKDRPIEKPIEKVIYKDRMIEKPVEKIVYKDKVIYKDRPVEKIVEKIVYKEKPVEKVVYKERIVEKPVERVVTKTVESGERIKALEAKLKSAELKIAAYDKEKKSAASNASLERQIDTLALELERQKSINEKLKQVSKPAMKKGSAVATVEKQANPSAIKVVNEPKKAVQKSKNSASAYRMASDATIYNAPGGAAVDKWEARRSFTAGDPINGWVKITGYFVNRVWQPAGDNENLWVKESDVIRR